MASPESHLLERGRIIFIVTRNTPISYFGVIKGNPSRAGTSGGLIINPGRDLVMSFAWVIGMSSNNIAEALKLLKDLQLAKTLGLKSYLVWEM